MPWSGSSAGSKSFARDNGTHSGATAWAEDQAAGTNIVTGRHDVHDQDLSDGINTALCKDGGNTATADIPMGGFTITNIDAAGARTEPARFSDVQDNKGEYVATVGGTADVITLTPSIAITAYAAGQRFTFIVGSTNTTNVTVNMSAVGAKAVVRPDGSNTALAAGDMVAGTFADIEYDGTRFLLMNWSGVGATTTLAGKVELATDGETQTGTDTARAITPSNLTARTATESRTGIAELATDAEAVTGTDTARVTTPANVKAVLDARAASDTVSGLAETATQAEMETATDTGRIVVPGRQHFHPGHPKVWVRANVSGGVPSVAQSYNVTSIADTAQGRMTVTIATDFSCANWCAGLAIEQARYAMFANGGIAAGTIEVNCRDTTDDSLEDPISWHIWGLGDQ